MNFDALDKMFSDMDLTDLRNHRDPDIRRAVAESSALERMEAAPNIVEAAEIMLAHITQHAPGFDPACLSSARQWCRAMFYFGASEGTRRTHTLRDNLRDKQAFEQLGDSEELHNRCPECGTESGHVHAPECSIKHKPIVIPINDHIDGI